MKRKIVASLLALLMCFGTAGMSFAKTPETPKYEWISPKDAYITSNLIVPISMQLGRKAELRIEIYKRVDTVFSEKEKVQNTEISSDKPVAAKVDGDKTQVVQNIQKPVLFEKTINSQLSVVLAENKLETPKNEEKVLQVVEEEGLEKAPEEMATYTFLGSIESLKVGALGIFNYEIPFLTPGEYAIHVYIAESQKAPTLLERRIKIVDPEEAKKYIDTYRSVFPIPEKLDQK